MLKRMRAAIRSCAPTALEAISYGIPTFKLHGKNLVHFGGFKDHISFFPTSSPIPVFKKELTKYKISKGTIQLPLGRPLPIGLIKKIVRYRIQELNTKK